MSFYPMDYGATNPGTPGWQFSPVPGWGMNPAAAGPSRVGVGLSAEHPDHIRLDMPPQASANGMGMMPPQASANGFGCPCLGVGQVVAPDIEGRYKQTSWGMLAAVAAGALAVGVFLGYTAGKRKRGLSANPTRRRTTKRRTTKKRGTRKKPPIYMTLEERLAEGPPGLGPMTVISEAPDPQGFDTLQQKWRQEPGTKQYLFEWTSDGDYGGYNSVSATSKKQAEQRARKLGKALDRPGRVKLRYREGSVQPSTRERERRYSAGWD